MSEALEPEVLSGDDQRVFGLEALEKELKEFSGNLPYDQARIIERTQDGFRQGVDGFYRAGLGLILIERNEGLPTLAEILRRYFPGISERSSYRYMKFARAASTLPNFKQFCLISGGYSKGLTMLESCSAEELHGFEENGDLLGYKPDEIEKMSVRQLQKALRRAKEAQQKAVAKATDKALAENSKLRQENEALQAALMEPDVQAAFKIVREAEKKFMDGAALLRKITPELLDREETVRNLLFASAGMLGRMVTQMEYTAQDSLNRVQAAEEGEE